MNNKTYGIGHEFTIFGCDSLRGWDIVDDYGNKIYETRFISNVFEEIDIVKMRKKKINNIKNNIIKTCSR